MDVASEGARTRAPAAARVAHARSSSDQIARVPSVVSTARRSVTRRAADSFIGSLELVDVLRPALVKQTGKRPVSEDLPAGLAAGAVVRLVLGVDDPLHRRPAHRTRLTVLAVHGHSVAEGGDLFRESPACLAPQP